MRPTDQRKGLITAAHFLVTVLSPSVNGKEETHDTGRRAPETTRWARSGIVCRGFWRVLSSVCLGCRLLAAGLVRGRCAPAVLVAATTPSASAAPISAAVRTFGVLASAFAGAAATLDSGIPDLTLRLGLSASRRHLNPPALMPLPQAMQVLCIGAGGLRGHARAHDAAVQALVALGPYSRVLV